MERSLAKPLAIACLGEAMIEMVADAAVSTAALGVAGDAVNTAIYLRRSLPSEHEVAFVSMVGQDRLSDRIAAFVAGEGVSTDLLVRHPERLPGLYLISTGADGERSFGYWREASAARAMFAAPHGIAFERLERFDVVFATAISLAILPQSDRHRFLDWIERFRARGGRFVFDSNYRPALWPDRETARRDVARAWTCCDIALPSLDDEMALFGDADETAVLERLRGYGVRHGALKRGASGPLPIASDAPPMPFFAPAANVVDTTAAGDSFDGAFLAGWLTGGDIAAASAAGHALAAHVVTFPGAIAPGEAPDGSR